MISMQSVFKYESRGKNLALLGIRDLKKLNIILTTLVCKMATKQANKKT